MLQRNNCICQRPVAHVECLDCHFIMEGRVRKSCPQHQRTFFLTDMGNCRICDGTKLIERHDILPANDCNFNLLDDSGMDSNWSGSNG